MNHMGCYVPGITRKELGNQIWYLKSQLIALLKFNKILPEKKSTIKLCTIRSYVKCLYN